MVESNGQSDVVAFLSSAAAWPDGSGPIERHDTHGAMVFLAGDLALKIKRAVKLPYLDFSTLALRQATLRRELALNQPQAPALYLDVIAITREADGRLAVGGSGDAVEWALKMRRFPQQALLLSVVERGGMTDELSAALADKIHAYHASAARPPQARERLDETVGHLLTALKAAPDNAIAAQAHRLAPLFDAALLQTGSLRKRRCDAGFVRRCHGDLHLGNIVVLDGVPTLFDALEFDETLATIDTLYDLAFLLMDLDRHGAGRAAGIVLDRYLGASHDPGAREGLAAMPLFLAARAAVRAVVALDRPSRSLPVRHVLETLQLAERYLRLLGGQAQPFQD